MFQQVIKSDCLVLAIFQTFNRFSDFVIYSFDKFRISTPLLNSKLTNAIHSKQTRSPTNDNNFLPRYKTMKLPRSIKYQGAKLWNSISSEIKKSTSVK